MDGDEHIAPIRINIYRIKNQVRHEHLENKREVELVAIMQTIHIASKLVGT